jgi:hypothetical protein
MKKKHRKIIINGDDSWAWAVIRSYNGISTVKIWKDKKLKYEKDYVSEPEWVNPPTGMPRITPGLISKFIRLYLLENN